MKLSYFSVFFIIGLYFEVILCLNNFQIDPKNYQKLNTFDFPLKFTDSPLNNFSSPEVGNRAVNSSFSSPQKVNSAEDCASICLKYNECISFNFLSSSSLCEMNQYGPKYALEKNSQSAYYLRNIQKNDEHIEPAISYDLTTPVKGVKLNPGLLKTVFETNIVYLLQFPIDDLLYYYRMRAGNPNPPGHCFGWDQGLKGSISGLFMMGTGGVLRWSENTQLRKTLNDLLDGIKSCQESNGYTMAYPENETYYHENPDYVLSWVTHGMIEASIAGNSKALPLIREHLNWFNYNKYIPLFLPPDDDANTVPPFAGSDFGHQIYLIYQGIIHNTRMALTSLGTKRDVELVKTLYQEDWWLPQLISRNVTAVWERYWFPHNYEIAAFNAYLDMYVLTGNVTYLEAMFGAWNLFMDHWIHFGGSMAINEVLCYPPDSYFLDYSGISAEALHKPSMINASCGGPSSNNYLSFRKKLQFSHRIGCSDEINPWGKNHPTGENCGSVFWIKFNQRFHKLFPDDEKYVTEIERSIYNIGVAQQSPLGSPPGIRYFTNLHKRKQNPTLVGTCCEGQGTRLYGSLPEYLYSFSSKGLYVDIYAASEIDFTFNGTDIQVQCNTKFPYNGNVELIINASTSINFELALRIPSWVPEPIPVSINGKVQFQGLPASYLKIQQTWPFGITKVTLNLLMTFKVDRYTGKTQIAPYQRYAYLYGPILLAAKGPWDNTLDCIQFGPNLDPYSPQKWLIPIPNQPLHFQVSGQSEYQFVPYFEIQNETFTVYPIIGGKQF